MIIVILLAISYLILVWQLINTLNLHRYSYHQLLLIGEKNYELINFYKTLGQSIMALNIQLQVAQKLWEINPIQTQESVSQAYQLSSDIMQELRQVVRIMNTVDWVGHSYSTAHQNLDMLGNAVAPKSKIQNLKFYDSHITCR
ncbi:histidine kinase dimerization/phosphoacceptor domain-containing protein [Nostoc sp. 106C]|uniref:histidine kinase dimerization/phosphoacceptor domain-containing protein n=1 Tax=Nostoc sp. 106C TaxID=1932667 RepID=UPI000A3CBC0E|nr:histidine kinase dimerization/phosphoacceptor domain-containing protein [Nostoc sp. 106C]OUL23114.1 hypothetical protein BV375_26535 [Nostoc sp. 106C]